MNTTYDIGQEIYVKAVINSIDVDKNRIMYRFSIPQISFNPVTSTFWATEKTLEEITKGGGEDVEV